MSVLCVCLLARRQRVVRRAVNTVKRRAIFLRNASLRRCVLEGSSARHDLREQFSAWV
jgi:hypothetical protein